MQRHQLVNKPFRFVLMILSQYSSVISAVLRVVGLIPAQLNTTLILARQIPVHMLS
jgi:hypothetical protein